MRNLTRVAGGLKRRLKETLRRAFEVPPPRGFCPWTRDWCASFAAPSSSAKPSFVALRPPHSIRRAPPVTIGEMVRPEFTSRTDYAFPPTFASSIPRGRVFRHSVVTPDNYLLADVSLEAGAGPASAGEHSIFREARLPAPLEVAGRVAVLSTAYSDYNYFHWMFDLLPRVAILREAGFDTNSVDAFIVSDNTLRFQRETLAAVGVFNAISGKEHPHVRAETLVVPSLPGWMGDMPEWVCEFLRASFLGDHIAASRREGKGRRIFISHSSRKVVGASALVALLAAHGFEEVRPEALSVKEQASLFNDAEFVVSQHGAGLANLVFCQPGTKVIEIFASDYVNVCYWSLSRQVGLDYHYLLGTSAASPDDPGREARFADIEINIEKLRALIESIERAR